MKTVITVIGNDTTGIIAGVSQILAENKINIIDISQTVLSDLFTMIMMVDLIDSLVSIKELKEILNGYGNESGLSIKVQHENIFNAMHKI